MSKWFMIMSYVMGFVFLILGAIVAFYPPDLFREPPYARYIICFILVMYGVFRLERVRMWRKKGYFDPPPGDQNDGDDQKTES